MPRISLFTLGAVLMFASVGFADTVTLKNGDKVEGRIINETDAEVVVEVQVTSSIKDERTIKKTDVASIDKAQPDAEAWGALKSLALGQESLELDDYQRTIHLLNGFITQFPQSAHAAEAKKRMEQFQEEQKRVLNGEMKLDGRWLSPDEVKEERVQITGRILLGRMRRHAAAGQLVEAMNAFDALERSGKGSASYPDAVLLARQILPTLKTAAEQQKARVKAQAEVMKQRLANTQGAEREQLDRVQKREAAQTEAIISSFEKSGVKWLPLAPATEKSLTALSSKASSEASSLNRHNVDRMRASIEATSKVPAALAENDVATAEKALTEASQAWPENELVKRLQPKIAEAKAKMAAEAQAKAKEAAEASAAAANQPVPATKPKPTPEPTPAPGPVAEPEPVEEESSVFAKPAFWVILFLVLGLAGFVMKTLGKMRDPEKNILDQ